MLIKSIDPLGGAEADGFADDYEFRPFAHSQSGLAPLVLQVRRTDNGNFEDLKHVYIPDKGEIEWTVILEFADTEEIVQNALSYLGHGADLAAVRTMVQDASGYCHECGPALSELSFRWEWASDKHYIGRKRPERITVELIMAMMRGHDSIIAEERAIANRKTAQKQLWAIEQSHGVTEWDDNAR